MKHIQIYGAALAMLLGSNALAQDNKPQGDKPAPRSAQPAAAVPAPFTALKGSDVMGAKVRDQAGEVGKVEDLIVDPATGRIEYAVLALSGDRAKGNAWIALPFGLIVASEQMAEKRDKPELKLNVDAAKLQSAPTFAKDKWPDFNAPAWRSELDKHFGATRSDDVARSADPAAMRRSMRASELMGKDLHSPSNDEVGEIKELVIDVRGARFPYVVISSGGFLGLGDKLHAIPWEAIQVKPDAAGKDKDKLVVGLAKDRVLKAPEFKKDDWARMTDRAWVSELYTYYGYKPYWSDTVEAGFKEGEKPRDEKDKKNADGNPH